MGRPPRFGAGLALTLAVAVLVTACSDSPTEPSEPAEVAATGAPSTSAIASSAPLFDAACDGALTVTRAGTLPTDLSSVSGLAASRRRDDLVWAVEDSFEPADLVALDLSGQEVGRVTASAGPLSNLDWEALAAFVDDDGVPQLLVGDLGDNLGIRPTVRLLLLDEPDPTDRSVTPRVLLATFADGVRPNVEAMAVHRGSIWVMDKVADDPATLYRLPLGVLHEGAGAAVFEAVGTFDLGGQRVTALDVSPDGTVLALRTSRSLRLYRIEPGADLARALRTEPCLAPAPPEPQGESVAILAGDAGIVTVSEDESGGAVPLHRIRRG